MADHPFDTNELDAIRGVCAAGLLTVDYAAAVTPLMADRIEELQAKLADALIKLAHCQTNLEQTQRERNDAAGKLHDLRRDVIRLGRDHQIVTGP